MPASYSHTYVQYQHHTHMQCITQEPPYRVEATLRPEVVGEPVSPVCATSAAHPAAGRQAPYPSFVQPIFGIDLKTLERIIEDRSSKVKWSSVGLLEAHAVVVPRSSRQRRRRRRPTTRLESVAPRPLRTQPQRHARRRALSLAKSYEKQSVVPRNSCVKGALQTVGPHLFLNEVTSATCRPPRGRQRQLSHERGLAAATKPSHAQR